MVERITTSQTSKLTLLLIAAWLNLACTTVAFAQRDDSSGMAASQDVVEAPAMLKALADAFGHGHAGTLMSYSGSRIDITMFGTSELFSRSQAGYVLRDFFDEHRPERLSLFETSGSDANWFAAGRYWYERGDVPLAVYFRLRRGDGAWELREIRISRMTER